MANDEALEHLFNAIGHIITGVADHARKKEAEANAKRRRRRNASAPRAPREAPAFSGNSSDPNDPSCCLGQRPTLKIKRKL